MPKVFTEEIVRSVSKNHSRPIIFALSNPTDKSECTATEAYTWSNGTAIFASGSPFDPVPLNGFTYHPGQGNNAYIFPGVGLGVLASGALTIPEDIFLVAAQTLVECVTEKEFSLGCLYPPLEIIRPVSLKIAIAVADYVFKNGLTKIARPENLEKYIETLMYIPTYDFVATL